MQAAAQRSIDTHSQADRPGDRGDHDGRAGHRPGEGDGAEPCVRQQGKAQTAYNYNVEKTYAGGYGGFQNGSTMKAFTIAAAIQKGFPLTYRIPSPSPLTLSGQKFSTCDGRTMSADDVQPEELDQGRRRPDDDPGGAGIDQHLLPAAVRSRSASARSPRSRAHLGMYDAQTRRPLEQVVSMTLGVGLITPLMLSNAYATFAARGMYCTPLADHLGEGLRPASRSSTPGPSCKQVLAAGGRRRRQRRCCTRSWSRAVPVAS